MKKSIKYAGIASALMITVSPITVPMIHIVKAESVATDPATAKEINIKVGTTDYIDPGTPILGVVNSSNEVVKVNYSITDENDNSLGSFTREEYDSDLFTSEEDAKNLTNPVDFGDYDGEFKEGDIYYQRVGLLFGSSSPINTALLKWNPQDTKLTLNGTILSDFSKAKSVDSFISFSNEGLNYVRKLVVGTKPSTNPGGNTGTNTGTNTNNNRPVVVAKKGIVTTHIDKSSYDLYNEDNKKVDNRALLANSSWKMDGERTVDGIKQYRVSTHEWVNASDVDFIEDGKVTEGMTVTKLDKPKAILLATTHNTYSLRNSNNEVLTNRALSGGTSWMVDKIGTDMHGGVYYGVSNDEFVKAQDGVDASL
ncbi:hypothetical protein FC72_GL002028 [Companilactobacillus tucceti DSM 20183]|uniref:Uncharacterized protein n=1 Tax=Companilactobacillus tucceti DSM 20183 TaxID=1423811 RepID=A0A0R1J076_9LACO|nr:SLAP domain-containing protein [Companilactobacillus tucceti]KRK64620.1 hypothetical protein FC72_GL002028 [Companilactobacillus tucceti DSM 20183]